MLEGTLGRPDAHGGVAAPLVVDVREKRLQTGVVGRIARDEHVGRLDPDSVERELGLGAAAKPHLLVGSRDAHPVRGQVDDDRADPLAASGLASGEPAPDQAGDRTVAAGHVVLVGVEAPAVAVFGELGAHLRWRRNRRRAR